MYDLSEDPACIRNLAEEPAYQDAKAGLKVELYERLKEQEDPRMFGRGYVFDAYFHANEQNANFYQRYVIEGEDLSTGWVNDSDCEDEPLPEQQQ